MTTEPDIDPVDLIGKILSVAGSGAVLHEPDLSGREAEFVNDAITSGWVSSAGAYVERFERGIAEFVGSEYAVATVNGTAALHMALILVGVEQGEEVIIPALTFVATANAVAYVNAVPHFADSERTTLGLDPRKLDEYLSVETEPINGVCYNKRSGRRIRAVVCMHTFGHPVDLDTLTDVCDKYGLVLIEDAAESLGSVYRGRHTGTVGTIGTLSFNGNKVLTTGGGGMILTDDPQLAARAQHLTTTAKLRHPWRFDHDQTGYNYRLPNLNAALGCAQLERLPRFLAEKRSLAAKYSAALATTRGVQVFVEPPGCASNYWLNAIELTGQNAVLRDVILGRAHEVGLIMRPAWTPMHLLPMYQKSPRMDLSTAEDLFSRLINLPSSPTLARQRVAQH